MCSTAFWQFSTSFAALFIIQRNVEYLYTIGSSPLKVGTPLSCFRVSLIFGREEYNVSSCMYLSKSTFNDFKLECTTKLHLTQKEKVNSFKKMKIYLRLCF